MNLHGKNNAWKEFQKEIPADNYYYARSCIRQNFFPASEQFLLWLLREKMGKTVFDDPEHTTCTGIGYHSDIVRFQTIQTVVARHFALMTEAGFRNLLVSCVTSFGIYNEILDTWKHFPEEEERTRDYLFKATGKTFELPEFVVHTSDLVYKLKEDIAAMAIHPLVNRNTGEALRVVEHVGCHYAKMFPEKGIGGAEFPDVLSGMVRAWGGEVIDYPERRHCCGFGFRQYLIQANRSYSVSNSRKKFEAMEPFGPDLIVANCPGCTMFMDKWQYTIGEMEGRVYGADGTGIPVLTYEELAGLVMGRDPWDLGLQMHQVDAEPLLDKLGIGYDPEMKYLGKNGKDLGRPAVPDYLSACSAKIYGS
ncbi:MAG: heterodisulfide reductase-related iron-sulfur binding cluster [Bacteroidota bacterium]